MVIPLLRMEETTMRWEYGFNCLCIWAWIYTVSYIYAPVYIVKAEDINEEYVEEDAVLVNGYEHTEDIDEEVHANNEEESTEWMKGNE